MSDLLDSYREQMPERCLTCPVFVAQLEAAEQNQKTARAATDTLATVLDQPHRTVFNQALEGIGATVVELSTANEMHMTRSIGILARHAAQCAGPKRGGSPFESVPSRIVGWLTNYRVCRSPGLSSIIKN